jgi:Coenzyme PQQ synthesis protein D (PqqD)
MRVRRTGIAVQKIGDETIVLDLESSRYLTIKGVGVGIFEQLADGTDHSLDDLVDSIVAEYEIAGDIARSDVERFLGDVRAAGLLEA